MSYISEALEYLNILDEDRSSKSTINSYMIVLLTHMLKCRYQNEYENKASWRASIRNSYKGIVTQFPVVGKGVLYKIFYLKQLDLERLYKLARIDAQTETNLPLNTFPESCPWTKEQLINLDFINNFIEEYGQDVNKNS